MRTLLTLVALSFMLAPEGAMAIKPYHCFGRIYFQPCQYVLQDRTPNSSVKAGPSARASFHQLKGDPYAKVLSQSFEKISTDEGRWRGEIEGNGLVELELQILRQGEVESTRYMGAVRLSNKKTTFNYRSVLPPGSSWSWLVAARAS